MFNTVQNTFAADDLVEFKSNVVNSCHQLFLYLETYLYVELFTYK